MSSDIINNLQLDKTFESSRVIAVKEINGCDSSFITSCVLGHCIKNKRATLLILTHNSFSHYQNIGLKMGYNLQKYIDSNLIRSFNLAEETLKYVLQNKTVTIDILLGSIKDILTELHEIHGSASIVCDGISHLFDLQFTLREVNMFCKEIIKVTRISPEAFVIFHCNVAGDDDITHVMANILSHQVYTAVEVENLPSGLSADVSGHLTINHLGRKYEKDHIYNLELKPSKYLFKLFDRGVKLLAPGTV